jgi:hypothetical protein
MGLTQKLGTIPLAISTDTSNNVGIGGSPSGSYKLEVTGTAKISSTLLVSGAATFSSSITANSTLSAYYGSITTGNTPATSGTTPVNPMLNLTNNRGIGMYFGGSYSGTYAQWIQVSDVGNLAVNYPLSLQPNGGGVNIGSSTTTNKQFIVNQTGASGYFLSGEASGTEIGYWYYDASTIQFSSKASARALTFLTTDTERMRITSGGKVTIGSTTLAGDDLFNVTNLSSTGYGASIQGGSSSSNYSFIVRKYDGTTYFHVRGDSLIFAPGIYNNPSAGGTQVNVGSDGNLIRFTSSIKYKKDIVAYDKGLDYVAKIKPVYYKSKNENTKDRVFAGLIAEDIHDLGLFEFVEYNDEGEPDSLHYQNMIALAFKAIQELSQQNKELNERLNKAGL